MIKSILLLLRPHQWLKNLFVFLPVFFDGKILQLGYLIPSIVMIFAYSLAASGIYIFNDIYDVESDKLHPQKCKRPIASGAVSKGTGYTLMALCILFSICIIYLFDWKVGNQTALYGIIVFYLVMNIAYCIKLKQFAIIDVFIIAVGFVLRIYAGGFSTGIYLSHWIVLMTFLLALFLAFAKRRDDVVIYENTGILARKNVYRYNLAFMNLAIAIVASITMVCYIMYTVSPDVMEKFHNGYVYTTSIFVLAGIIRYLQITVVDIKSGSPTLILQKDRFIKACLVGWLLEFALIIYTR
jgi:4-hydroxybenzoate polyprenyltransferase